MLKCVMCNGDWLKVGRQYDRQDNSRIDYYCANCQSKRKPVDDGESGIADAFLNAVDIDDVFDMPIGDSHLKGPDGVEIADAGDVGTGLAERVANILSKARKTLKPEPVMTKSTYFLPLGPQNILLVGDIHEPFCLEGYREFCQEIYEKWNCDHVMFMGDVIDSHYSSFHNTDPDGMSASDELDYTIKKLAQWKKIFPNADVCLGNHDMIVLRKAFSSGLSKRWVKDFHEVLEVDWNFQPSFTYNNTLFRHGLGQKASPKAGSEFMNVVQGHFHTESYVHYRVGRGNKFFGMQVPCGVDRETYALAYAQEHPKEAIGCGVLLDYCKTPIIEMMDL